MGSDLDNLGDLDLRTLFRQSPSLNLNHLNLQQSNLKQMSNKLVLAVDPLIPESVVQANDQLPVTLVLSILDASYNAYDLEDDEHKILFRQRLYHFAFLNGTSDKWEFEGNVTFAGKSLDLGTLAPYLAGKTRKFFRTLQYDAYKYLTDTSALNVRIELINRYGIVTNESDAVCLVDFFKECHVNGPHRRLAKTVREARINNSSRSKSTRGRERVETIEANFAAQSTEVPEDRYNGQF